VARAFRRKGGRFVARLDEDEREVVVGLLEQTRQFLAPVPRAPTGDPFDDLVARLGMPRLKDLENPADQLGRTPRDPALDRLLPSAHRDDPALAAEFRRLTEHGLREGKAANLSVGIQAIVDADGDKVWLDHEQAQAMVVALTDVRLLLGERLGLRTDDDADALQDRLEAAEEDDSEDDPRLYLVAYYDFMTWLQESLIQALMA
jgi:Domain of unknown function (DUF2017)